MVEVSTFCIIIEFTNDSFINKGKNILILTQFVAKDIGVAMDVQTICVWIGKPYADTATNTSEPLSIANNLR